VPYSYSRPITVDHTKCGASDSANFTAVFAGTYAFLKTAANGGRIQSASGYDIIFATDAAGIGILNFERVSWDPLTGTCQFWVHLPSVSHSADTVFYIVYGNPAIVADLQNATATWPGQYKAVYHLESNAAPDSTGNNDITSVSGAVNTVPGQIGSAQNGTGLPNGLVIGGLKWDNLFDGVNTILTIAGWFYNANPGTLSQDSPIGTNGFGVGSMFLVINGHVTANNQLALQYTANGFGGYVTLQASFPVPLNAWYHVVFSLDLGAFGNSKIYANGAPVSAAVTPTGTPPAAFASVRPNGPALLQGYNSYGFNGSLDEIHFSNTTPTDDSVLQEFNNQSSPATFYALGAETSGAHGGGQVGAFLAGL
jgi:Concanavalin A-like lectin/glucanases superfamily/Domain of unknown function (DUF2341)